MSLSRRELMVAGGAMLLLPAARRGDPRAKFLAGIRRLEAGSGAARGSASW